ncbi:MAG: hypothetical protein J6X70_05765 [Muribaculaceae bacterium]|nr:hypothetical protein [Muribaculaceae bacterium]
MADQFEIKLHNHLREFLLARKKIDERFPECPDVEGKWQEIAIAYLPDGMREYNEYPTAALGWMMYIGMAVAKFWDKDWEIYSKIPDLYGLLKNKRGYDLMDEYVREDVLLLRGNDYDACEALVGDCAARAYSFLSHQGIEGGTRDAFDAFVSCLRQLYLMGMAVQLKTMGYHLTKLE